MAAIHAQEIEELVATLASAEASARQLALMELAELADGTPVAPVARAVSDADPTVRRLAVELLEEIGDATAAGGGRPRPAGARAGGGPPGETGHPARVAAPVRRVDDVDEAVRVAAQSALRALRDERAVEPLLAALAHPSAHVRQGVLVAL